jgi:hypothetical protein
MAVLKFPFSLGKVHNSNEHSIGLIVRFCPDEKTGGKDVDSFPCFLGARQDCTNLIRDL